MPIFRDDLDHATATPCRGAGAAAPLVPPSASRSRRLSDESIRTEFCDGPLLDEPTRPATPCHVEDVATSDRTELIEMLKRGASPTWIPTRHLESIMQQSQHGHADEACRSPMSESHALLPSVQITPEKDQKRESPKPNEHLRDGLSIERPRSALHSGDFTTDETVSEDRQSPVAREEEDESHAAPDGWFATSPPRDFVPFALARRDYSSVLSRSYQSGPSSLSSSLCNLWYQPPTTPLVQSETSEELVSSLPARSTQYARGGQAAARRHTLYASHPSSPASSPPSSSAPLPLRPVGRRRDGVLPYQAHQPRRSLPGTPNPPQQYGTSPQAPAVMRARRLSMGSDLSPLHHASMVGSYEESILRGRMSTTPSKPIEFLAQIGVLGKGNCRSSLQCPPHVTLPFPAVYYSYDSTPYGSCRRANHDGPSPYVGQIDLENGLAHPDEESRSRRKTQSRILADAVTATATADSNDSSLGPRRASRPRRRGSASSSKAPPGGSYRIPEQGQIQIVVKNQNKTAVKLFLVPYDLTSMPPGTKTFIRQRSYSAAAAEHPVLRYLVHLHICSPAKGRFYLYKSIRIVFANRVPDGKEKLRNETTWPDPRFAPYRPVRLMNPPAGTTSGGPAAVLVAEKALHRRSLGVPLPLPLDDEEEEELSLRIGEGAGGFAIRSAGAAEGLLSQRLRGLKPPSRGEPCMS